MVDEEDRRAFPVQDGGHPLRDLDNMASVARYERGQAICLEARSCEHWHRLVTGAAVRRIRRADGSFATVDIIVPGDYFGFPVADDEGMTVRAAARNTTVATYPRWCVEFLAEVDPAVRVRLRRLELDVVARTRVHFLCRRRMESAGRLNALLLELDARLARGDGSGFDLPLPLEEIADYLDLSVSTVERHLASSREHGAIDRLGGTRIRVLDRTKLMYRDNAPAPAFA
jgi:CRP-like cAMP-binding protein